ncbi:MAG TPA: hypothetical protein VFD99_05365 [Arthrobacter sp.]|jgi:hypothetical protein|nr:hypothetical protein [Arthrobacter sp.]
MSTQANEPEDIVKDGAAGEVRRGEAPVSRKEGPPASQKATDATEGRASAEARGSEKVPGPAEDQDEKTPDDRGLTTDSSPD